MTVLFKGQFCEVLEIQEAGADNPRLLVMTKQGRRWIFKSETQETDLPF
jgi:hypothetical protein